MLRNNCLSWFLFLGLLFLATNIKAQTTGCGRLYVDSAVTTSGNGNSWTTAFKTVSQALDSANSGSCSSREIWVAKGTYYPMAGLTTIATNRESSFCILRNGIKIYGGFSGIEKTLSARNVVTNPTILSGDIGINGDSTDNSYHVMIVLSNTVTNSASTIDTNTCIDGLTFENGHANGFTNPHPNILGKDVYKYYGGGMYIISASPLIKNCNFFNNRGTSGGGMYNNSSHPILTNNSFSLNESYDTYGGGGGICNNSSSPSIINCSFYSNVGNATQTGGKGGGIYNISSSPLITNCTFHSNRCEKGGGIFNNSNSWPSIKNCTFSYNQSSFLGGAICSEDGSYLNSSFVLVNNCTFLSNKSSSRGGGIYNGFYSSAKIVNCMFSSNNSYEGGGLANDYHSSVTVDSCSFILDSSTYGGGGIYNRSSSSSVTNCIFSSNNSFYGAGICSYSSSISVNKCVFYSNTSGFAGGGMYNNSSPSSSVANCIFGFNNSSQSGGAMTNDGASPAITNCTFAFNSSNFNGGGIYNNYSASPSINNCILWGNTSPYGTSIHNAFGSSNPTINYTTVETLQTGIGNSTANPLFVNAANLIGPDGVWRTSDDGLRLTTCSPAINTGSNASISAGTTSDITDTARIQNTTVDRGAYEMPYNSTGISVTTVTMLPTNPVCSSTAVTFTAVTTVPGSLPAYQWYKNGVAVGTAQNTFTFNSWANNDSVWVVHANNSCSVTDTSAKKYVQLVPIPVQPGTITGSANPCPGAQNYSVSAVPNSAAYTWTVPAGWTITAGQGTAFITATATTTTGNVTVTAFNSCAAASVARTLSTTPLNTPAVPYVPTGPAAVCASSTGNIYSTTAVAGATTYTWAVPAGWTIAAGQGTTAITATAAAGSTAGNITVSAGNGCQTSPAAMFAVSGGNLIPAVAVSKNTGDTICAGTAVTFAATPTIGGTSPAYQWKKNGANTGTNSAAYTDNTLADGDTITVVLTSNSACASVASVTSFNTIITVLPNVLPTISITGAQNLVLCAGASNTFSSNNTAGGPTPAYQWYLNGIAIPGATYFAYTGSGFATNDSLSVLLTSTAVCRLADTVRSNSVKLTVNPNIVPVLTVTATPGTSVPAGGSVTFTANLTAGGANATYQWLKNGVAITGATSSTYTTSSLQGGDLISVRAAALGPCANLNMLTSVPLRITDPAGIQTVSRGAESISLYPNPSSGRFTVSADWETISAGEKVQLEVLNSLGQVVWSSAAALTASKWQLEVQLEAGVANGLYLLRVQCQKDGNRVAKPLLIQR